MLLPKLDLSQPLKQEILPHPSTNKHLHDALFRETMVRHRLQGFFARSYFHVGPAPMSVAIAIAMMMVVMVVMVIMAIRLRTMRGVRQEVDDHEDPARLETRREPLRRQVRVVKVVEPEPDDGEVKAKELGVAEGLWVLVTRHAEVALERDHLIFGEALSVVITISQQQAIRESLAEPQ